MVFVRAHTYGSRLNIIAVTSAESPRFDAQHACDTPTFIIRAFYGAGGMKDGRSKIGFFPTPCIHDDRENSSPPVRRGRETTVYNDCQPLVHPHPPPLRLTNDRRTSVYGRAHPPRHCVPKRTTVWIVFYCVLFFKFPWPSRQSDAINAQKDPKRILTKSFLPFPGFRSSQTTVRVPRHSDTRLGFARNANDVRVRVMFKCHCSNVNLFFRPAPVKEKNFRITASYRRRGYTGIAKFKN